MRSPVLPYLKVELYDPAIPAWVEIQDDLLSLTFSRGNTIDGVVDALDIGEFSITIKGDTWSPATNPVVRPGRFIRVRGLDHASTWQDLYFGNLGVPTTVYTKAGTAITTLPGYDVIGVAGQARAAFRLYDGADNIRYAVACSTRSGTPTISANRVGSADAGSGTFSDPLEEGQTNLEQITIVRNSMYGTVWASRSAQNTFNYRTASSPPSSSPLRATFSDTHADAGTTVHHYAGIVMSHDAESLITGLTFDIKSGTDVGTQQGPYRDTNAVAAGWLRRDAVIPTVYPGNYSLRAQVLFGLRPLPTVTAKSVTIDGLQNRSFMTDDLIYYPVRVKNAAASHNEIYHVLRETHTVTPDSWSVEYDLRTLNTFRSVTVAAE